jgi:hypothetical protein
MEDKAYNILRHFLHHFKYNIKVIHHRLNLTTEYKCYQSFSENNNWLMTS